MITLICPEEATQFIEVRKPVHVLHLPTACSATSPNLYLPSHDESPPLGGSRYLIGYGKSKRDKYIISKFSGMTALG